MAICQLAVSTALVRLHPVAGTCSGGGRVPSQLSVVIEAGGYATESHEQLKLYCNVNKFAMTKLQTLYYITLV